jgi:hypothetical protein
MNGIEPMEVEQLHPRPSAAAGTFHSRRRAASGSLPDRIWMLVRLYAEAHPVIASVLSFVAVTAAASAAWGAAYPHHGPRGRHRIHHDYTKIDYHYNFRASQMDHWCLFVRAIPFELFRASRSPSCLPAYTQLSPNLSLRLCCVTFVCLIASRTGRRLQGEDTDCTCEDFTDPSPRREAHGWNEAFGRNQRWASSAARRSQPLDFVLLGDGLVEIWNGLGLGAPVAYPSGSAIQSVWNSTFTRAGGGALEGLALGIRGDSVRA